MTPIHPPSPRPQLEPIQGTDYVLKFFNDLRLEPEALGRLLGEAAQLVRRVRAQVEAKLWW